MQLVTAAVIARSLARYYEESLAVLRVRLCDADAADLRSRAEALRLLADFATRPAPSPDDTDADQLSPQWPPSPPFAFGK